jgi:hypothetical protein
MYLLMKGVDSFETLEGRVILVDVPESELSPDALRILKQKGGSYRAFFDFYLSKAYYSIRNVLRI